MDVSRGPKQRKKNSLISMEPESQWLKLFIAKAIEILMEEEREE